MVESRTVADRSRFAPLLLLLVLVLSSCGRGSGEQATVEMVDATPAFLASAAERSGAVAHRMEMFMSFSASAEGESVNFESDSPLATGVQVGDRFHFTMDLREMFTAMIQQFGGEEVPSEFASMDLSMEFAGDPTVLYLRAPFLEAMGAVSGDPAAGPFGALADGWGKVDLTALGEVLPGELTKLLGGAQAFDPSTLLDMLRDSADVEELGTRAIRGGDAAGLSATVSLGELLKAQGMDADALAGMAGGADVDAALASMRFPIEVWVNSEGQIARIVVAMSSESLAAAATAAGEDTSGFDGLGFDMTTAMDFFDYGASLSVELPADAVDLTEAFRSMLATSAQ